MPSPLVGRSHTPLVSPSTNLPMPDFDRYARQIRLSDVGVLGQRRLGSSRVAVVGTGGLGSPVLSYLAAAGVGHLTIIDDDTVAESNLHRQLLHATSDVGRSKVASAAEALTNLNPNVTVSLAPTRLHPGNADELLREQDLLIDGSDNFATHYTVDDAAAELGIPCVWGSVAQFMGQTSISWAAYDVRYRDVYPQEPLANAAVSCADGGVLGPICGVIGSVMATEAIKLITGAGTPLLGTLLVFDGLDMTFRPLRFHRAGDGATVKRAAQKAQVRAAQETQVHDSGTIAPTPFNPLRATRRPVVLIDVREPAEHHAGAIPGSRSVPLSVLVDAGKHSSERLLEVLALRSLSQEIVVYCSVGTRSAHALALLRHRGFTAAKQLSGGYQSWLQQADDPVLSGFRNLESGPIDGLME